MNVVRVKDGVLFERIAPAGFRILSAIDQTSAELAVDLVITSGTDGTHSGPLDPHHRGEAYDVRSQGFSPELKHAILSSVMTILGPSFFGFIEDEGAANEHFHVQIRKGTTYPENLPSLS